jgi:hypothetical protein
VEENVQTAINVDLLIAKDVPQPMLAFKGRSDLVAMHLSCIYV